jgi:hypothetical protein
MTKQYKNARISLEAYNSLKSKQIKMNEIYKKLTGKTKIIPMSRIITIVAKNPVTLWDDELMDVFKNKKGKQIRI